MEIDSNEAYSSLRGRLAEHVRRLRLSKSISQEVLSAECGFHRTYISQVERAATNITIDNLERLATGLGIDPAELLCPLSGEGKQGGGAPR